MGKVKLAFFILLIPLGIFFFIYGGYDDSPGAQLIGALAALTALAVIIRDWRRSRQQH